MIDIQPARHNSITVINTETHKTLAMNATEYDRTADK